jgi:benzoyl-CoA reductase/2-hydroxyglutaryl-CoA dehydratase subunit BcrC/BadD/HgdB
VSYPTVIEQSNQVLKALVDAGERVLGYIYPHPPHELIISHGLKPSLVRTDPAVVGAYEASLQTFACSLTRNLFSQRVNDSFPELAGILFSGNTCDALQNVGDVWQKRFPEDKVFRLTYPVGDVGESSVDFLAMEIKALSDNLASLYGNDFSESNFKTAALLLHEIRDVLQLMYCTRLLYPSFLSYNELSHFVGEFLTAPTQEVSERMRRKWEEASERFENDNQRHNVEQLRESLLNKNLSGFKVDIDTSSPRIVVIGGMIEPRTFAGLIKNVPGFTDTTLVLDMFSLGFKTVFTPPVNVEGEPFKESARSILGAHSEPTQEGLPKRVAFLKDVLAKLSIQGLIVCEQSFCDPDEFESPSLEKAAEEVRVPTVRLPLDSELSDRARIEGRIQTFLETIDAN